MTLFFRSNVSGYSITAQVVEPSEQSQTTDLTLQWCRPGGEQGVGQDLGQTVHRSEKLPWCRMQIWLLGRRHFS
jgi:hypothetical protein